MNNSANALQQYARIGAESAITCADPHELVRLLYEGALQRITAARGCIERGEIAAKGEHLARAIAIVDCLRVSLDHSVDEELTGRLEQLYDYFTFRLVAANSHQVVEPLQEVHGLISGLRDAWEQIKPAHQAELASA